MAEAKELFNGWDDFPPVFLSVKMIASALGGFQKPRKAPTSLSPEDEKKAFAVMQESARTQIAKRADPRWLPILEGRDKGLPKAAPVFDIDEMRKRNLAVKSKGDVKHV